MPQIALEAINVSYLSKKQSIPVLKGLCVSFHGDLVNVIIGESGSGKSTLLKLLAGTISPDSGQIYFDDLDVTNFSVRDRNLALVNQNIALYPHLNVFRNIAFPLEHTMASGEEIKERVYEASRLLHIEHLLTRKPKQISLGQAQRVAIAKAIIKRPNVLLFDEPFSNLDAPLREQLRGELKKLLFKLKTTVIFVTHSSQEAMAIGDFVYVMADGKIAEEIASDKLLMAKSEAARELIKSEFGDNDVFPG